MRRQREKRGIHTVACLVFHKELLISTIMVSQKNIAGRRADLNRIPTETDIRLPRNAEDCVTRRPIWH